MTTLDQDYELAPLSKLTPHPDNPRRGDVDAIKASVDENGFYGTIVAQKSTGYVLAGNHRYQAAKKAGMKTVPVVWIDVDDDRAKHILLVDNRSNDLAAYDNAELATLLQGFDDLTGTGYTFDDLDDLLGTLGQVGVLPPQDTGAEHAETDEDYERRASRDGEPLAQRGLREVILIVSAADHEELTRLFAKMRQGDSGLTQGEMVVAAMRVLTASQP